ncbi:DUF4342 domain-containing protein, partial [Actinosynnema sp. NPDC023658]|uniref:DUF4342 domain-containing protein n=1 Tax=Actinosynnema sp. NPDC023658 TaxID=3155465 RepID=UPI0033C3AC4E
MTEQERSQLPGIEALTDRIRQFVHEGNSRRVVVRNGKGEPVVDIPVTAGVVAAVAAPVVTAVAALAALAGPWSVDVEGPTDTPPADTASADEAPDDNAPAGTTSADDAAADAAP